MPMRIRTFEEWVMKSITAPTRRREAPGEDKWPPNPAAAGHEPGDDDADAREREEDQSDLGHRVVRRAFHPLARAVEGGVNAERDEGLAKVGAQELLVPSEHPDVDQGPAGASLPDDERRAENDRGWKKPPGRRREARHEQQQAGDRAANKTMSGMSRVVKRELLPSRAVGASFAIPEKVKTRVMRARGTL